jgi:shikimate kinase
MEILNNNSITIYLRANIGTLVQRLSKQKEKRPLIARISDENLPEFIAKHLFERNIFYNKAQYVVDTDRKTPEEIVEEITTILQLHP